MNPSRIGVLSTLHAANLQLSASFFVEVARTQALRASDAPSPINSSLFSVGMLRSSITSSFFEVLAVPERSGGPPRFWADSCRLKKPKKLSNVFQNTTFERFWAGQKNFRRPRGAQKCTQNHEKACSGDVLFRAPVSTTIWHRFGHILGGFDH